MDFKEIVKWQLLIAASLLTIVSESTASEGTKTRVRPTWRCENKKCIKEWTAYGNPFVTVQSFSVCSLLCGDGSVLWPLPKSVSVKGPAVTIKDIRGNIVISYGKEGNFPEAGKLVQHAQEVFYDRVRAEIPAKGRAKKRLSEGEYMLKISIQLENPEATALTIKTDESYFLVAVANSNFQVDAIIRGVTFFGVRHGLETLSQLIVYDNVRNCLVMPSEIEIDDKPAFPYRGLMLDTSRNYFSVKSIKRTINAMSANKLNSFHWHITDSHSFPLKLKMFPQFADYGAYDPDKIYTEDDIKMLVDYARVRGVRIVPEFDGPGHTGEGWQWTPEGTILCFAKEPWASFCLEPPCGQLNPLSSHVYNILGGIYEEYIRLFKPDIFHMGGDEVHMGCWNADPELRKWMKEYEGQKNVTTALTEDEKLHEFDSLAQQSLSHPKKEGFYALWSTFQRQAFDKLNEASFGEKTKPEVVIWTSDLTDKANLPKLNYTNYIIQVWTKAYDPVIAHLLENNQRIILSNYDALYLDCGYASWIGGGNNWCKPYKAWQQIYTNTPMNYNELPEEKRRLILGQEAPLWTETAAEEVVDARFWPRGSALAERVWTNPTETYWRDAERRLLYHRDRMVRQGVAAEILSPEWCNQNRGGCS